MGEERGQRGEGKGKRNGGESHPMVISKSRRLCRSLYTTDFYQDQALVPTLFVGI